MITRPFLVVLVLAFLGFSIEQLLRPVVPLMVIDRGGDVLTVGVVSAVAAAPAIVFRPAIGRLIDVWDHGRLLTLGAAGAAITPVGMLLPGIAVLAAVRFVQGSAWAVNSVSMHVLIAKLAPADRRGEASGCFLAMPALATLVAPGVGIALYLTAGDVGPVAVAVVLGVAATAIAARMHVPRSPSSAWDHDAPRAVSHRFAGFIEPSALPATLMITLFMAAHALFTIFPAIYALSIGAPLETLAVYYPLYGLVMSTSQLIAGKASDRIGRGRSIRIGCALAIVGIAVAAVGGTMPSLLVGGLAYAAAISLVAPTMSALTMDRAPTARIGSAMATYSLGYRLATGASALLWSAIIAVGGFWWAFVAAIGLQLMTLAASLRFVPSRGGG